MSVSVFTVTERLWCVLDYANNYVFFAKINARGINFGVCVETLVSEFVLSD